MSQSFSLLAVVRRQRINRVIKEANWAQLAVVLVYFLVGVVVATGSYFVYREYFQRMLFDDLGGPLIARYILESGFALIFFLGVISFIVTAIGIFYRNKEVHLLFSLPLRAWKVYLHRFTGAVILAAWPALLLGIPAIIALGNVLRSSAGFYFAGIITLILFVLFIAIVGGILSFLLAWVASRVRTGFVWAGETVLSIVLLAWLIHRIIPRTLFSMFHVSSVEQAATVSESLSQMFGLIPSHYFVDLICLVLPFSVSDISPWMIAAKIALITTVSFVALMVLARFLYLPIWHRYQEDGFLARPEDVSELSPKPSFPRVFRYRYSYLFEKELLVLGRDAESLARAGFILFLLFLYLLAAGGLSRLNTFVTAENFSRLTAFVFAVVGYFALTLCLRFVFPSMSSEGKSAWIIWSSPCHLHELFSWKLFFWTAIVLIPMEIATGIIALIFGLPLGLWLFLAFAVICTSIALVSITLGQGFLFPNFHDPDPDVLATSPAGLASVALGLGYLWVAGHYVQEFTFTWLARQEPDLNSGFGLLIVTLAVLALYWIAVPRRLERMEID